MTWEGKLKVGWKVKDLCKYYIFYISSNFYFIWMVNLLKVWPTPHTIFCILLKNCISTMLCSIRFISSVQFSSVAQSCPILCNPMDCSMPGFPVHHQLQELTQTHVYQVSDAIQSSHPLSSLSPPSFNLPQHQGLFKWVSSLHQVAKVLEFQLQHQSFPLKKGLLCDLSLTLLYLTLQTG